MAIYTKTGDAGETGLSGGSRVSKGDWLVNVIGQVDELNSHIGLAGAMMESTLGVKSQELRVKSKGSIDIGLASLIGQLRDVQRELFEVGAALALNPKSQIPNAKQIRNSNIQIQNKKRLDTQRMAEEFVNKKDLDEVSYERMETPKTQRISEDAEKKELMLDTARLERLIDEMEQDLPRLQNFILPGGGVMGAQLMVARAVCRRSEREFVRFLTLKFKVQNLKLQRKNKNNETMEPWNHEAILKYLNRLSDYLFVASRWVNWLMSEEEVVWKR